MAAVFFDLCSPASMTLLFAGISARVGRVTAGDALYRGFDSCRRRPRGVALDFGPKQSGWLVNKSAGQPHFVSWHVRRTGYLEQWSAVLLESTAPMALPLYHNFLHFLP